MVSVGLAQTTKQAVKLGACVFCVYVCVLCCVCARVCVHYFGICMLRLIGIAQASVSVHASLLASVCEYIISLAPRFRLCRSTRPYSHRYTRFMSGKAMVKQRKIHYLGYKKYPFQNAFIFYRWAVNLGHNLDLRNRMGEDEE